MKDLPAISVIVTVYNNSKYIGKCIRSVLNQKFTDLEIILVNDGSVDKSLQLCQKYASRDSRIQIIDKQNEGVVKARKDGVLKSLGDYICFIDGDDYLAEGALNCLYNIAKQKNVDMVVGKPNRVYDNWGIVKRASTSTINVERLITKDEILPLMFAAREHGVHRYAIPVWGRLYKRSCVLMAMEEDPHVLFPQYNELEDWLFNLSVAPYINSMWNTTHVVYHYRYGGRSQTWLVIRGGGGFFFDVKYERCILYGFINLLPFLFSHYVSFLLPDLVNLLSHKSNSKSEIDSFVYNELSTRKIVLWARENIDKNQLTSLFEKAILDNDAKIVKEIALQEGQMQCIHYWKMKVVKAYQILMDSIGQIEEFFR